MSGIPDRYVVFDTETSEKIHRKDPRHVSLHFRLGVGKFVGCFPQDDVSYRYVDFCDPEQFYLAIDGIPKGKGKVFVFAHNLGFDLRIIDLFGHVSNGRYTLLNPVPPKKSTTPDTPFVVLDDPPTIIRLFRPDGQEFMWIDTWQWLSSSLAKIGTIVKSDKLPMPSLDAPLDEWFIYCRQDVDVLDIAMSRIFDWLRSNNYKAFHPTRAGQAKLIYSQRYERKRIQYHNDPELQAIERPSYYGGYTECMRIGSIEGPIHQVDANSLYPFVMSKYWYPSRVNSAHLEDTDSTVKVGRNPKSWIAQVYLDSRENAYPVRCKEGTIFARGKVRTILAGPELQRAFVSGDVRKTTLAVQYGMEPLFVDFVRDLYSHRLKAKAEGNEVFDYCYKLMLNSLYGKFGQLTSEWEYSGACDPKTLYTQGYVVNQDSDELIEQRILAGTSYTRQTPIDHPKSFVAIAAYITAYAREYMRSIREEFLPKSVYYQATDSLYINDEALEHLKARKLLDSLRLGAFKHEATYSSLFIRNIHNLDKDDKKIRGSVRSKAVEIDDDTWCQDSWESLLPGLKAGHHKEVHIHSVTKKLLHRYDRQTVGDDGWCVPYRVNNWKVPPSEQAKLWLFRRGDVAPE